MTTATTATDRTTGPARGRSGRPRKQTRQSRHDVVVVGAGAAGLSAALALKDQGLRPLVLERADNVGASWRTRPTACGRTALAGSASPRPAVPEGNPDVPDP